MASILTLDAAEEFTSIGKKSLIKLAKSGQIPASFINNRWFFIDDDLIECIRSNYNQSQGRESQGEKQCLLKEKVVPIGTTNLRLMEKQYSAALERPTKTLLNKSQQKPVRKRSDT